MSAPVRPDCHVVIRAAGERTEAACARLAALQVGEADVTVIHEVPFAQAVRRGFEIGVEAGRRWTLCLDADVLLQDDAIARLCDHADREWAAAPNLFELDASVADKILGQVRPAGVHLYRTSLLPEALERAIFDPRRRRPESWVKTVMRRYDYRTPQSGLVVGLHDFEQYHRDIFRKVFTHVRKHARYMGYAPRYWRRLAARDEDMRMAYLAWSLSVGINTVTDLSDVPEVENVSIDIRAFPDRIDPILLPAGMREKAPLPAEGVSPERVRADLAAFAVSREYNRARPLLQVRQQGQALRQRAWRVRDRLALYGKALSPAGARGPDGKD